MLDGRLKLRHLQCFLAVAEERSIQRAAERLAITQPAVSKTLRELEEILGAPLFRRGRRGAVPTTAAEVFLRHARASVAALEQGVDSLAQARQRGGVVLRLGLLPSVAPCFAPPAVLRFRTEMPGTLLRVASGPNALLLAQLQHRELDVALTRLSDPEHMTGLTFEHLYADALALAVHPDHPLLREREPGLERALRYPAIVATPGTTLRQSAESLVAAHGLALPEDRVETLSVSFARALTRTGDMVWFAPIGAIEIDLSAGLLARVPLSTTGTEEPIGLALRADAAPGPALQVLIGAIRAEAARWRQERA
ncbi:MAG: pca operon transcription factor PcaQ [Sphingomonadaceae bacterium]